MTVARDDAPIAHSKMAKPDRSLIARAVTINRPAEDVYSFFRDFSNLPSFMDNIERIDILSPTRSHWVVKAPLGRAVEWDATVTEEVPGATFTWQSDPGADVANSGRVTFEPVAGRGTVVTATLAYDPPLGTVGKIVAKLFQREPAIQARRDLRRLKQLLETGEIATAAWTRAQRDEDTE